MVFCFGNHFSSKSILVGCDVENLCRLHLTNIIQKVYTPFPKDATETAFDEDGVTSDNGGPNSGSDFSESPDSENPESEHMAKLREFQIKLLASSNTAYNNRSKSGRRHTLCLTR